MSPSDTDQPLANRLRPDSLDNLIGQTHLVGENKPLRLAIEQGRLFSMVLWGPPGVGKTTLARILATATGREFIEISAVSSGKKDMMAVVAKASELDKPPVLFIDEIHRFNKAQQDYLLPYVEHGNLILVGATTENPSFEVIGALLSRLKVFILKPLSFTELDQVAQRAIQAMNQVLQLKKKLKIEPNTLEWVINAVGGDARRLINLIEQTATFYHQLDQQSLSDTLQHAPLRYDKAADEHYDTISAFIKSMRAGNTDGALYYLARMVAAGEDPKFIARRMTIFASEDIGLAVPTALVVANGVFDAVHKVGYPEAQIILAHGVAYLAQCQKDRRAYDAYFLALADVEKYGNLPIPLNLRNAPTKLMKEAGYGKGYSMYPDQTTSLLPDKLKNKKYLIPKPEINKLR